MKSFNIFIFLSTTLVAFLATSSATPPCRDKLQIDTITVKTKKLYPWAKKVEKPSFSFRGPNGFRYYSGVRPMALSRCGRNPKVCAVKGSAGPNCCSNKCVNLQKDRLNCGRCGTKCGFSQICCGGVCVNPKFNRSHCGSCNNRCKKGGRCSYGMCSYA